MQRQPDISKAKSILDWELSMRAEGLEEPIRGLDYERLYRKEHRDFVKFSRK